MSGPARTTRGRRLADGLSEGDIRKYLADGGKIRNVLVVTKPVADHVEHQALLRITGHSGFLPFQTWGGKSDKLYRDFDRLLALLRDDFDFQGGIIVYREDDPDLARFCALACTSTGSLLDQLEDNLLQVKRGP